MSPARPRTETSTRKPSPTKGSAPRKASARASSSESASASQVSAGRTAASALTDADLRNALAGLAARAAMPWPHSTGLGQMMMWAGAYARGLLSAERRSDAGPYGAITH